MIITWYNMETNPISSLSTHASGSLTAIKANTADCMVENNIWKNTMTINAGYFFVIEA